MADNTTLNPGTLGDVIASDDISGVKFQRVKLVHGADGVNAGDVSDINGLPAYPVADPVPYWPSYGAPSSADQRSAGIDEGGALSVRGAVLTDEGTFRVNFANTSLAVALGSVTVSGATVTGTNFNTTDVHFKDYFKLDADGEANWTQIASIDSPTQLTLVTAYPGGASGAASRSLVQPTTASGGTVAVASGQCTLASGTTSGARAVVGRQLDYAPLVWRTRLSISQRIANQSTRFGLVEFAATARWYARFKAEGTTNTVLICESARNPTAAPAGGEIETTTITLPNGLTTASLVDYRVEMLTESVRFYVAGVLVAEHTRSMPSQFDILGSGVLIENTGTAGSNTNVIVDYITGKNHNKLEVGVMSEAEKIVAAQPPMTTFNFSQAGVIAINTTLLEIDCRNFRGLSVQVVSIGTTGQITPQWSNDGTTWVTAATSTAATATNTQLITAASLSTTQVAARYFRLRLTTATTAGTTTIVVMGYEWPVGPVAGVPIVGSVTIGTNAALVAGTALVGDVGLQVRANATGAATTSHLVSAATTNAANIKNAAGRVLGWASSNTTGVFQYVKLHNSATAPTAGAGVFMTIAIPPNGVNNCPPTLPGIAFSAGIGRTIVTGSADTDATATTAGAVIFDLFYA